MGIGKLNHPLAVRYLAFNRGRSWNGYLISLKTVNISLINMLGVLIFYIYQLLRASKMYVLLALLGQWNYLSIARLWQGSLHKPEKKEMQYVSVLVGV